MKPIINEHFMRLSMSDSGWNLQYTRYIYMSAGLLAAAFFISQLIAGSPQVFATSNTLGNTSIGTFADTGDSEDMTGGRFTMPSQAGTATSMSVYIVSPVSPAPNDKFQLGIYSDVAGNPGSLIANSSTQTITPNAWNTVGISANLSANTPYWLVMNTNGIGDANSNLKFSPGSPNQMKWKDQAFGTWPETFGTPEGSADFAPSIYATYTIPPSPSISPIAYWAFNEGSGTQASDSSGNNNHATLVNGATWAPGIMDKAVILDGISAHVRFPPSVTGNLSDFSYAGWVYWKGGGEWQRIFDVGSPNPDASTGSYMFFTPASSTNSNPRFSISLAGYDNAQNVTASTATAVNQWVHLSVVKQGTTLKIYQNGILDGTGPISINPSQLNPTNSFLGKSNFPDDPYFHGLFDDVRFYNRALTNQEISQLVALGTPPPPPPTPTPTPPPPSPTPTPIANGQVVFSQNGTLAGSPNLFWDNVKSFLGIGTSTPQARLDVLGDILASGKLTIASIAASANILANSITAATTITGADITATGNMTANNLTVNNDLNVLGNISAASLELTADANIAGDLNVSGILSTGGLALSGDLSTPGNITAGSINGTNLSAADSLNVGGDLDIGRNLILGGEIMADNALVLRSGGSNQDIRLLTSLGGSIELAAGLAASPGLDGGQVKIQGGSSQNGMGGFIQMKAGDSLNGNGGDLELIPGFSTGGTDGILRIRGENGTLSFNLSNLSGLRIISFPDASGTVPLLDLDQIFTGLNKFEAASQSTIYVGSSIKSGCIAVGDSDGSGITYITVNDGGFKTSEIKPAICK